MMRRRGGVKGAVTLALATLAVCVTWGDVRAQSLSDVFDRVAPSVVVVHVVERDLPSSGQGFIQVTGLGSGVVVSADGLVMTAAHVVHAASVIEVAFSTGERVRGRVIASEPSADVSLLKLDSVPAGAVVARLADSDHARIGDRVFIVGAPYGLSRTLTVGHLSGRLRPGQVAGHFELAEFLQTDGAVNQGNSGGPMFDLAGEVLGIVSHLLTKSGGFEGLGFVVASNTARRLLLEEPSPWHGVDGVLLDGDLLKVFNLPAPGMLIQRVVENSPAERIGLRGGFTRAVIGDRSLIVGGDVILEVQGVPVAELIGRRHHIGTLKSGERLTITRMRAGRVETVSVEWP